MRGIASDKITLADGPLCPDVAGNTGAGCASNVCAWGDEYNPCGSCVEPVPPSRITVGCAGSSADAARPLVSPAAPVCGWGAVFASRLSARICVDCSGSGAAVITPNDGCCWIVVFSAPSYSGGSPLSSAASTRSASSAPSSTLVPPPNSSRADMPLDFLAAAAGLPLDSTSLSILRCSSRICCSRFISSANCSRIHDDRFLDVNTGSRDNRNACSASCISLAHWKRSSTSRASALAMMRSSSGGTDLLIVDTGGTSTLRTFSSVSKSLSPMNRRSDVSISYRIVPMANTSERRSSGSPRTCSGDM